MMQSLVAQLTVVLEGVGAYREAIGDFFARLPAAQWIRTLPIGDHGITAPTLWARLGDAPGRWESFRHLQAQAGTVPVTIRSGKQQVVRFRFACDKSLRYIIDHVAFLSLRWSEWAHAYYAGQRARGHSYRQALLRALSAKWLKIIFVMWERQIPYDEQYHLAMMTRQQLRQRQAWSTLQSLSEVLRGLGGPFQLQEDRPVELVRRNDRIRRLRERLNRVFDLDRLCHHRDDTRLVSGGVRCHGLSLFGLESDDRLRKRVLSGFAGESLQVIRGRFCCRWITALGGGHSLQLELHRAKIA